MTFLRPALLAGLVGLAGCAQPIVLRPQYTERQVMHRSAPHVRFKPRAVVQSTPAPACPVPIASSEELAGPERHSEGAAVPTDSISAEQKESVFRDFADYLRRSGTD
jgi:hypothetical protein